MILTFRNLHNWIKGGKRRSGVRNNVQDAEAGRHPRRGGAPRQSRQAAGSAGHCPGYVREGLRDCPWPKRRASSWSASPEINAKPQRHRGTIRKGVWMLPPGYYTVDNDADRAKYEAIGESDRFHTKIPEAGAVRPQTLRCMAPHSILKTLSANLPMQHAVPRAT